MAYVVAPLVNWGSVRRVVSSGAGRLRREARALGIFGGGGGGGIGWGPVDALGGGPGGGDAAAAAVLTACAECGADPAKVILFCSQSPGRLLFCFSLQYCRVSLCFVVRRHSGEGITCPSDGSFFPFEGHGVSRRLCTCTGCRGREVVEIETTLLHGWFSWPLATNNCVHQCCGGK